MRWKTVTFRWLLYVATGLSAILLAITVALWLISESNYHLTGSPILTFAQWGDSASGKQRTILLDRDISFDTSWDERWFSGPLPPGAADWQTVYDYNLRFLGFWWYQDHIRPVDNNRQPMPGVFGRSRGFSLPLGWLLFISLILPLRPLVLWIVRRATLAGWRTSRGLCAQCGYD